MNMATNAPDLRHLHSGGTIGNLVVNAIARFGDQPAIADGKVRWSYREFGDTVGRFISLFRSLGLKKGSALSILASTALLAGCGGFESQRIVDQTNAMKAPADAYHQALYDGYVEHMTFEQDKMMNYTSAIAHARKAEMAAHGQTPPIASLGKSEESKKAQKNAAKNRTSEAMKRIMP